jgi:hypothetical protein
MPASATSKTKPRGSASRPQREFAPAKFSGQRNRPPEVAEGDVFESATGPVLAADQPQGNGIVVESGAVLGGGAAQRRAPAARGGTRTGQGVWERPTWTGAGGGQGSTEARWMGAGAGGKGGRSGERQDQVLDAVDPSGLDQARSDGTAVAREDLITRREPGPAPIHAYPCSCRFEFEVSEDDQVTILRDDLGLSTSFRGQPKWLRSCITCGGLTSPPWPDHEYAARYGAPLQAEDGGPPSMTPIEVQTLIKRELERGKPGRPPKLDREAIVREVSETVMTQMADALASDGFMETLAERITARLAKANAGA